MRRMAPRPLAVAIAELTAHLQPASELARVQRVWEEVAGEAIAAHCSPVSLRGGVLRVACDEAVWAAELELLAPESAARSGRPRRHRPPSPRCAAQADRVARARKR